MGDGRAEGASGDAESQKQRVDRELIELLNELRVSLPGVQVLFAFLLTVPFSAGFARLTAGERSWYFATFLATAGASAFLMAPTSYHRILFRDVDKERMIRTANRFAIVGTALLSLAIGGAVFVVADVMYATAVAGLVSGAVVAVMTWLWFGLPLWRRANGRMNPRVSAVRAGVSPTVARGSRVSGPRPAGGTHSGRRLLMAGTDDRAEGKWDETKGKVKEGLGDATDNESLEREGKADQVEGKKEQAQGHLKEAAKDVREGVDDALDR